MTINQQVIEQQLQIFLAGLADSLSYHRTLPIIVTNQDALYAIGKIFGANVFLIFGSMFLFHKGIMPFLDVLGSKAFDYYNQQHFDSFLWVTYQSLWLVPIGALCYICCLTWYNELADSLWKKKSQHDQSVARSAFQLSSASHLNHDPEIYSPTYNLSNNVNKSSQSSESGVKAIGKQGSNVIYGLLVWFIAFVQMQGLTVIIPLLLFSVEFIVDKVFQAYSIPSSFSADVVTMQQQYADLIFHIMTAAKSASYFTVLLILLKSTLLITITIIKTASICLGLLMMSTLYGWYAFDPTWIAAGISSDERFGILHKHFTYFVGFGLPYVLINRFAPFFIGFSGFLIAFPFCIILGAVTDYTAPYKRHNVEAESYFKIFRPAQRWTLYLIQSVGGKAMQRWNKAKRS